MTRPFRLLADDLTGALDSAAAFGAADAPVPVVWSADAILAEGPLAFDAGTREVGPDAAARGVREAAPRLFAGSRAICFKKIDSLLRGSEAEEIHAVLDARPFPRCVVAPAFPAQGRVTRGGRQGVLGAAGSFRPVEADLAGRLEAFGHAVSRLAPGQGTGTGIAFVDAESDADLDAVVAAFGDGDVLWVGSAGLAAALARRFAAPRPDAGGRLRAPLLGLFGTDHPVMLEQLGAVRAHRVPLSSPDDLPQVAGRLAQAGVALVSADLPPGTARGAAARAIASLFGELVRSSDAPATLLVAGGETLRGLCEALGADRLDVVGEVLPGIPRSILVGGRWSGTLVVSKSGAFGAPGLLRSLLADLSAPAPGVSAA